MKKAVLLCVFALFFAVAANAAPAAKMVFWYPGEAGSTEEAGPVLEAFFDYVNGKPAPEKIGGSYFNTVEAGLNYIKSQKPVIGIVSFSAWEQNKAKFAGAIPMLATLPLPHGKATERYAFVGRGAIGDKPVIYSSEPLAIDFVRQRLFASIPPAATLKQTRQILSILKKISDGTLNAFAILTPSEAATIEKMSAPWVKQLKTIERSKDVPTASVILFDPSWKGAEKLKAVLLTAGSDPNAQDILDEMRLKGFAMP